MVMMFTPSTITRPLSMITSKTVRGFLRSLSSPVITTTESPFLILYLGLNLVLIAVDLSLLFVLCSLFHVLCSENEEHKTLNYLNHASRFFKTGCKDTIYNTSGASEMIFIYPLSLNSLATGPKIRVPLGSSALLSSTTALSSKRI